MQQSVYEKINMRLSVILFASVLLHCYTHNSVIFVEPNKIIYPNQESTSSNFQISSSSYDWISPTWAWQSLRVICFMNWIQHPLIQQLLLSFLRVHCSIRVNEYHPARTFHSVSVRASERFLHCKKVPTFDIGIQWEEVYWLQRL